MARSPWFARAWCVVIAAGLGVDAYVHLHLAGSYSLVRTSTLNQADLFRAEGVAAILAAVVLVVWPNRLTALFAFLVSAGGAAAVVLYTQFDPGQIGPLPDMYEPVWFPEKTNSLIAEAVAAAMALLLLVVLQVAPRGEREVIG